ncbi:MAG TPA: zf-HC2 domain-containing protein [Thermoanaerobaculia bacterium]|nr:zf-HC2 domain-containing protein [Thermoanaerobaculia bacterium]
MTTQQGEHLHPEILAAFLDGNLRGAERSRVVAHLAACEDCYEVFSDSAHILEEEEAEELEGDPAAAAAPGVLRPPRSRWRTALLWTPLAVAALLALLLVPWRGPGILPVDELTAGLGEAGGEAVSGTLDSHWSPYRDEDIVVSDPDQVAFRLGVRAVGVEMALRADDSDLARGLAVELAELLRNVPLSEPVQVHYVGPTGIAQRLAAGDPPRDLLPLHHQGDRLLGPDPDSGEAGFTDPFWYRFGKWAGAAQLAALTGNREWFEQTGSRRLLRELRQREMPPDLEEPLDRLARELEAAPPERDLGAIAELLGVVIRTAGSS